MGGVAHSLFTQQDYKLAGCLVKVLKDAGQEVPPEMLKFDLRIRGKMFDKFFNKDGTNSAPVQCYRCNDTGHISRDCPQGGGGGGFRGRGGGRGFGGRGGGEEGVEAEEVGMVASSAGNRDTFLESVPKEVEVA